MSTTLPSLGTHPHVTHVDNRRCHAEALLEEFTVSWLGHQQNKVEWVQIDRELEDLCRRVLLFLDPQDEP
jgi:hypothetical protein